MRSTLCSSGLPNQPRLNNLFGPLINYRKSLPPDIQLSTFYDQSILVRDSISSVVESIAIGLVLSVAVLVGFLKNARSTLVAAIVIPIATLVAIVFMKLWDASFNLMTLGGLAACIGVVIDDAIVMVESIMVHMSMGQTPADASRNAIRELTSALIGSTLTPIVVFLPLVFLGGITAVFFRALAMTLVTALLASLFLAIFFTPVLAGAWLRSRPGQVQTDELAAERSGQGRFLLWLTGRYEVALEWGLGHAKLVLAGAGGVFALTVFVYYQLGSGFLPDMDEGAFVCDYRMPPGTSLQETDRVLRKIEQLLRDTPEIESYSRRTGARLALAIAEPNFGDLLVKLRRKRKRSVNEVTAELRRTINREYPAIDLEFAHILEDLITDLASAPQPIEIKIFHDNEASFKETAAKITEWIPRVRGVVDVVNRNTVIGPSINYRVDTEKAHRAGFGVHDVQQMEAAILDGELASNMIRGDRLIGIRVRYPAAYRNSSEKLRSLLLTSPTGVTLPLASIAHVETTEPQTEIRRENLRNMATVTARLENRDLGSTMDEIRSRLFKEVKIPPGTDIEFGGSYQIQRESFLGLTQVLLMSMCTCPLS